MNTPMTGETGTSLSPYSGSDLIGTFNNESRDDVALIKQKAAEFIDIINIYGQDRRRNAIACTHIEEAAMMAVKSVFN